MAEAGVPAPPRRGAPRRRGAGVKSEAGETPALSRNCIPGPDSSAYRGSQVACPCWSPAFAERHGLKRRRETPAPARNGHSSPTGRTPSASPEASPGAGAFSFDCDAAIEATAPDAGSFPVEVTDSVDNAITLEQPPQRIVSP